MKWLIWLVLLSPGCGWFTSSQLAVASAAAVSEVAKIIERETGKSLDDLPSECEMEHDPVKKEVLTLCTISYADLLDE